MTDTRDHQSLSNLELIVLARLSCSDGANEDELAAAIAEVAPPDGPRSAREHASEALAALRRGALATHPTPSRKTPDPRSKLTEAGGRTLRAVFGQGPQRLWTAVRARYVPALALGIPIAAEQASKLGDSDELTLTVLRRHFGIAQATTTLALCDALIAKKLGGFTGEVTLLRLRAHVLAHDLGLDPTVGSKKELEALAERVASKSQDGDGDGRRPLRHVLGRRWAYQVTGSRSVLAGPRPVVSSSPPSPPHAAPARPASQPPAQAAPTGSPLRATPSTPPARTVSGAAATPADLLLTLVREAIPRIGADGRFGDKVFVSAIWRYLEDDGRLAEWSLDRFKRWLVTANRDQLLDLARADARGEMDSRLVEESEIHDLGSTFHFVVDRRVAASGRGFHAR